MLEYKTVEQQSSDEFIERRSKFIGYVRPVTTEDDAISFINEIRAKHWDATHNVYAYSLRDGNIRRYSDDGEPQGTAGIPVLDVIQKTGVQDVVVVVTRYFGGIMLGAGGLVRAYSHGAKIALESGNIIAMALCYNASVKCDYNQYGRLSAIIHKHGGKVVNTEFFDNVSISFYVPADNFEGLKKDFADATCGSVEIIETGEEFVKIN